MKHYTEAKITYRTIITLLCSLLAQDFHEITVVFLMCRVMPRKGRGSGFTHFKRGRFHRERGGAGRGFVSGRPRKQYLLVSVDLDCSTRPR